MSKFGAFLCRSCCWNEPSHLATGHMGAEEAIGWIDLLQRIHSLLEIVFCQWSSVRVCGPALNVAAVGMRMQTHRESTRVRLDGWSLHEDPAANAESSGDEIGALDCKLGEDAFLYWKKRRRNSVGSASVPVSGHDTVTWFATAVFMLIAFALRALVVMM